MAENPNFNNNNMFIGVNDETYNDIDATNNSEVLATQGNVINSIKVFWNKLRAKLKFAVTRENTSEAVGGNYQPIFVNENGGVQICEPRTLQKTVTNNNISLSEISSPYPGQIVCITVTNNTTNNTSFLKINNKSVYYPTGAQVKVSDVINNTIYLFTFISGDGDKWILNNNINVASDNNSGLMTKEQYSKLNGIDVGANKYELPTANSNTLGGVKSTITGTTQNRDYNVQVIQDGTMKVNVPWTDNDTHYTARLYAGNNSGLINNNTQNGNTYLKIVENNNVTSTLKILGSGDTSVISNSDGSIIISSPLVETYNSLSNNNNSNTTSYTIKGPGDNNANTSHFLAGNGTWVNGILVPNNGSNGQILKWGQSGPYWASAE